MIDAGKVMLVFYLRPARRKAKQAAMMEVSSLLRDLEPTMPPGGPLAEEGGLFWGVISETHLADASARFERLGYSRAVDLVVPIEEVRDAGGDANRADSSERITRWRRRLHRLVRLYEEDPVSLRERAPDRRTFLFESGSGEIRAVRGYRGSSAPLSRRGLPVYDAKLLVNLVFHPRLGILLDPFAGAGGVVIEARTSGWSVVSCDIDPALRHGLAELTTTHIVCDVRQLPIRDASIDAIATESPYGQEAAAIVPGALREMSRVCGIGARIAVLCAEWQADMLRRDASTLSLYSFLDCEINRKGTSVVALAWEKREQPKQTSPN